MSQPAQQSDHTLEVAQMERADAEKQRMAQDAKDTARKAELAQLRGDSVTAARGNANNYFSQQGLVPDDYASGIDSEINRILSSIPRDDPNPGGYFSNVGQTAYNTEETGLRNRSSRSLDRIFAPNFAETRLPFTLDDASINSIDAEQYSSADDIIKNMLGRRVITDTGAAAARKDLDRQRPGVQSRLQELGQGIIGEGQNTLRGVANRGRSAAGQLTLGTMFDPNSYSSEADQAFSEFLGNLPTKLRASAPGNLYSTSGLAAVAGTGSGAQNTAFDPAALSGTLGDPFTPPRTANPNTF